MHKLLPRLIACAMILASPAPRGFAQGGKKVAVLPAQGQNLSESQRWQIAGFVALMLEEKYTFAVLDEAAVKESLADTNALNFWRSEEYRALAEVLRVDELLQPAVRIRADTVMFAIDRIESERAEITHTARRPCPCRPENINSFPIADVLEVLYETPDIILGVGLEETALPLPPPIDVPATEAEEDSSGALPAQQIPAPGKTFGWGKYAAGAVLVGGGLLFVMSKGKSNSNTKTRTKLPDPPDPPGSN